MSVATDLLNDEWDSNVNFVDPVQNVKTAVTTPRSPWLFTFVDSDFFSLLLLLLCLVGW